MPSLHLEHSIVDDRYEVRRRLSHGSYAEIYEAYDLTRQRRPVIIKALNTSLQGTPEEDLERTLVENFQNEAIALDTVGHPNVVRRLGHGTAADLSGTPFHYIVLEFMPGGDLMALCRQRPLTLEEMLYYVRQLCEALALAHERGVIHRDIKPQNLLLSADGATIKVTDFGVAKVGHADPKADHTRVGTDLYAPPEHNPNSDEAISREQLTCSADVYSLAKTIYAAMTGKAPRMFARLPISELPAELATKPWGARLLEILRRATATAVADRYPNVMAFRDDLVSLEALATEADEQTRVRPRGGAAASTGPLVPTARPEFAPTLAATATRVGGSPRPPAVVQLPELHSPTESGGASPPRIVVDIGASKASAPVAVAPAPVAVATRTVGPAPLMRPAPHTMTTAGGNDEVYSYREDLRDLVWTGWKKRIAVFLLTLVLLGAVSAVFFEVYRAVSSRQFKQGSVTALQLTLRDGPSTSANDVGRLPQGTRVRILEKAADGQWLRVEVLQLGDAVPEEQPDSGWVGARFVAIDPDSSIGG